MKNSNIISMLLALLFAAGLSAQQVTLRTPDMTVEPGANIHLDVQVKNFSSITGIQFSVNWDKDVLEFIGVDNFGLPVMSTVDNFGTMEAAEGKLRFAWYQQELTGVTLNDNSQIFSIWFKAIGNPSESSSVMITNDPIVIEVVSVQGSVPFVVSGGTITLSGPTAANESKTTDFTLFQNVPNPFANVTYIGFELNKNTETQIRIYDQAGRTIFEKTGFLQKGSHTISINREMFQSAGAYLFSLKTPHATATRQLAVN